MHVLEHTKTHYERPNYELRPKIILIGIPHICFGQSVVAAATPTWARPRATNTERVSSQAALNLEEDQW